MPTVAENYTKCFLIKFFCVCVCVCVCVFWLQHEACGILVLLPGIKPVPHSVQMQSPKYWTTKEVPSQHFKISSWHAPGP